MIELVLPVYCAVSLHSSRKQQPDGNTRNVWSITVCVPCLVLPIRNVPAVPWLRLLQIKTASLLVAVNLLSAQISCIPHGHIDR